MCCLHREEIQFFPSLKDVFCCASIILLNNCIAGTLTYTHFDARVMKRSSSCLANERFIDNVDRIGGIENPELVSVFMHTFIYGYMYTNVCVLYI